MRPGPLLLLLFTVLLAWWTYPLFAARPATVRIDPGLVRPAGYSPPAYHQSLEWWRINHRLAAPSGQARATRRLRLEECQVCHQPTGFCNACHDFVGGPRVTP